MCKYNLLKNVIKFDKPQRIHYHAYTKTKKAVKQCNTEPSGTPTTKLAFWAWVVCGCHLSMAMATMVWTKMRQ